MERLSIENHTAFNRETNGFHAASNRETDGFQSRIKRLSCGFEARNNHVRESFRRKEYGNGLASEPDRNQSI
ncbi:MAG: hypothetical protein ACLP05_11415 [Candidatus Kryptoniota bacterium]